ncbi:Tat pathway signal sequence domain protein [Sphingomonas ginsenosidivorax]|uniref:Tat pathway signal sequence domain protein n=1 Tax=Sphingomonas ginsenosidivorax TaxID=862135 RepID=A0A5C6UIT5_9SPHN|nr:DUF6250 domain-containing protein [Sphingomonas ginsenosidivorax]TXC72599.1 Tat pathway signal sequence domain protein [Sphingomonas ginsenosidivorax]
MMRWMVLALLVSASAGDARNGSPQWRIEADKGSAKVSIQRGVIDVQSPDGVTLWYRQRLSGPVRIDYDVMAVSAGGANDAVSDVNAFWMARDPGTTTLRPRDGAFASYDGLETYYVGIGGNRNTTTRFRRYIGRAGDRPLRPQDDRQAPGDMLTPNVWMHVRLIADGSRIAVERDGKPLFALTDPAPYTSGLFGLRTTKSHLRIRNVTVTSLRL